MTVDKCETVMFAAANQGEDWVEIRQVLSKRWSSFGGEIWSYTCYR